jgi:hypothetical protein
MHKKDVPIANQKTSNSLGTQNNPSSVFGVINAQELLYGKDTMSKFITYTIGLNSGSLKTIAFGNYQKCQATVSLNSRILSNTGCAKHQTTS